MSKTLTLTRAGYRQEALQLREFGWTQQRIADTLEVPQQTISYWLSHNAKSPSWEQGTAITLGLSGMKTEEIARELGKSPSIIRRWVGRYAHNEAKRLCAKKRYWSRTIANVSKDGVVTNNGKCGLPNNGANNPPVAVEAKTLYARREFKQRNLCLN